MKHIILISIFSFFIACTGSQEDSKKTMTEKTPQNNIVEENKQCICTKEFRPVCGSNGKSYPNPCQAGCEGITEFKDGSC